MPVYGVADYLEQTLQSVAAQTFEDFEVILVDDCSPDDSPKICDAWVKKDERMTVLHLPENGGLSNARNAGFPHVRGEYVFFMDSDDVIDANLLEQVKASLEVNRADVVVFGLLEQYYDRAGVLKQTFPVAVEKRCICIRRKTCAVRLFIWRKKRCTAMRGTKSTVFSPCVKAVWYLKRLR